jgi:hypothetical protein
MTMAVTKKEGDETLLFGDFAYGDPSSPSTWKLRIDDAGHVGGAIAALHGGGYRGSRVRIPAADLPAVKKRVAKAWLKFHPDKTFADLPAFLQNSLD